MGALATATRPDNRVERLLIQLGLKYEVDNQGDFKFIFGLGDGRSQVVFVNSNTNRYGNMEIREVWSPAHEINGSLPALVANHLLEDSGKKKLGAWEVHPLGSKTLVVFAAKVSADIDATALYGVLKIVTESADEMEQEISGGDRF